MGFTAPSGWNIWKMRFEKQSEGESDMKYYSTRDAAVRMDAAEAIKMGLSRDGGLLTPCEIPQIDRAFLESLVNVRYQERAAKVMGLYLTDYTYEELSGFAENAYGPEKFDCDAVAPVRTVDETTHCLELWHGPTSAFKDMALQMLPQLLSAALRKTGESKTVCILVATSGDTGKALPTCRRRRSWYSTPRTACPRSRRPRWLLRTAPMWASAPWRATSTTPRPV